MDVTTFGKGKVEEVFASLIDSPENLKFKRKILKTIAYSDQNIFALKSSNLSIKHKKMFTDLLRKKEANYLDALNCKEELKTFTKNIIDTKFKVFLRSLNRK